MRPAAVLALLAAILAGCAPTVAVTASAPAPTEPSIHNPTTTPAAATPSSSVAIIEVRSAGFSTPAFGWAETNAGLYLTDDAGRDWHVGGPPIDYEPYAVKGVGFADALHGLVVSEDTFSSKLDLWRTDDGGRTWSASQIETIESPEVIGNAQIAWVGSTGVLIDIGGGMPNGYRDDLLVSSDRGRTWSHPAMRPVTPGTDGVTGTLAFTDMRSGWLAGGAAGSRLWRTQDGGQTWVVQDLSPPSGFSDDQGDFWGGPRMFDSRHGAVARSFASNTSDALAIYTTDDGGSSWARLERPVPSGGIASFVGANDWLLWAGSTRWQSRDAGASWVKAAIDGLPFDDTPNMVDADTGWTSDSTAIWVTPDGGLTWQRRWPATIGGASITVSGGVRGMSRPDDQATCSMRNGGGALVEFNPIEAQRGLFARITLYLASTDGTLDVARLAGPPGWPGLALTTVVNPAGGAGGPTWSSLAGSGKVSVQPSAGIPAAIVGTIDATLGCWKNTEGLPDPSASEPVHIVGSWSCAPA